MIKAFLKGLRPAPRMLNSKWAQTYRTLTMNEGASEPGKWRNERTPYLVEIMDCVDVNSKYKITIFMAPVQCGKTENYLNIIGKRIHLDPTNIFLGLPTEKLAKRLSKTRLYHFINGTPVLKDLVHSRRVGSAKNSVELKEYPGGALFIIGANSESEATSSPAGLVIGDEADKVSESVGKLGNFFELLIGRMTTFVNGRAYFCGTPAEKATSHMWKWFKKGDQRRYHVPCPYCGEMQTLEREGLKYDLDKNKDLIEDSVRYQCKRCKRLIEESQKTEMLAGGKWIAANPSSSIASFQISGLYRPYGWHGWVRYLSLYLEAESTKDASKMRVWQNEQNGMPYEPPDTEELSAVQIKKRCEKYIHEVPKNALVLTAGVDVQGNRLELEVVGWGVGEESWGICNEIFEGDPAQKKVWADLKEFVYYARYKHATGQEMRIVATGIDTGYRTMDVYNFIKANPDYRFYALKGMDGEGLLPVKRSVSKNKGGIRLHIVGVSTIKENLYARLLIEIPGAGYCHFPISNGYDDEFFEQLTSEKRVSVVTKEGFTKHTWVKQRDRNEALDKRVYATAAMLLLRPNFRIMETNMLAYKAQDVETKEIKKRTGKNWATGWKD